MRPVNCQEHDREMPHPDCAETDRYVAGFIAILDARMAKRPKIFLIAPAVLLFVALGFQGAAVFAGAGWLTLLVGAGWIALSVAVLGVELRHWRR